MFLLFHQLRFGARRSWAQVEFGQYAVIRRYRLRPFIRARASNEQWYCDREPGTPMQIESLTDGPILAFALDYRLLEVVVWRRWRAS